MSKTAVLLAGGMGTRLHPYTVTFPKPLMPIGNLPILEILIRQLKDSDFKRIVLAVNHQAELIKAYFGSGEKWGISIEYSLEPKPLGTMGPLKLISNLPENFLVMNGDILTNLNFSDLYSAHVKAQNIFTISSYRRFDKSSYGVLSVDEAGHLVDFKEKPELAVEVSMGVYIASSKILEIIPENKPYGFDHLVLDLIRMKKFPTVRRFEGHWLDIGIPSDYEKATDFFLKHSTDFLKDFLV